VVVRWLEKEGFTPKVLEAIRSVFRRPLTVSERRWMLYALKKLGAQQNPLPRLPAIPRETARDMLYGLEGARRNLLETFAGFRWLVDALWTPSGLAHLVSTTPQLDEAEIKRLVRADRALRLLGGRHIPGVPLYPEDEDASEAFDEDLLVGLENVDWLIRSVRDDAERASNRPPGSSVTCSRWTQSILRGLRRHFRLPRAAAERIVAVALADKEVMGAAASPSVAKAKDSIRHARGPGKK